MLYRQLTDHCFLEKAGAKSISKAQVDAALKRLDETLPALKQRKNKLAAPLLDLPAHNHDLAAIETLAGQIRKRFSHIVVAGAGGSGLSGRTLASLNPAAYGAMHFLENIDPDTIDGLILRCKTDNPCFLIISKSGTTVETLAHFYVLLDYAESRFSKEDLAERFTIITMPGDNPLRQAATERGMRVLDHASDIGGRFSILTNVGLLPAACAGLDLAALRKGAGSVVDEMDGAANAAACKPALGAAIQYAFMEQGRNVSVIMPYAEQLAAFSMWYRQCWAESLGKGGKGSTPVCAIGTTDQHSQLQLYLDGPEDKLLNIITLKRAGSGQPIKHSHKDLAYLRGKTTGDVMEAEQKATVETLIRNGRPLRLFELGTLKEEQMGALLMHFMLEIIFMGHLLGVNPFDQPAVEESKQLARQYLSTGSV